LSFNVKDSLQPPQAKRSKKITTKHILDEKEANEIFSAPIFEEELKEEQELLIKDILTTENLIKNMDLDTM
jgi:hypothetical protein